MKLFKKNSQTNIQNISTKELSTVENKEKDIDVKINSIIESAKKEEKNKNHMNKILQTIKNKNSAFMK